MKRNLFSIVAVAFLLFVGGLVIMTVDALTLEDAPVSAALGKIKSIINTNNDLIEAAFSSGGGESPTFVDVTADSVDTGKVTTDNVIMDGGTNDSLAFSFNKAATFTGQVGRLTLLDMGGFIKPTDYYSIPLLVSTNDSLERITWAEFRVYCDDETTNTEDSAVELWIPVNGVNTKVMDINAASLGATEVVTNIINTTYTQVVTYVDGRYVSQTTDP